MIILEVVALIAFVVLAGMILFPLLARAYQQYIETINKIFKRRNGGE